MTYFLETNYKTYKSKTFKTILNKYLKVDGGFISTEHCDKLSKDWAENAFWCQDGQLDEKELKILASLVLSYEKWEMPAIFQTFLRTLKKITENSALQHDKNLREIFKIN